MQDGAWKHTIYIYHFSNREDIVIGHLPRNISTPCHLCMFTLTKVV